MSRGTVISIDAMGGDRGPAPLLDGMVRILSSRDELGFIVHGDEAELKPLLDKRPALGGRCEIRHTTQVVSMSERPSRALRDGRDSSMWRALQTVADGDATVAVSCGNTGALMAMAIFVLRKAPGIDRPAIAVNWPSRAPHGFNTVLDMGADVRADAHNLLQYAVMGAEYAHLNFGIERPRVGLINVGTESSKGPQDLRDAARIIEAAASDRFEFVGFVEGTDLCKNRADVLVTDGFTGNVALKAAEGTASFIRSTLRDSLGSSLLGKLGAFLAMGALRRMGARIDPRRLNGGVFLGLNGSVVKSHGGADAIGFASALSLAAKMADTDFPRLVAQQLARHEEAAAQAAQAEDPGTASGPSGIGGFPA